MTCPIPSIPLPPFRPGDRVRHTEEFIEKRANAAQVRVYGGGRTGTVLSPCEHGKDGMHRSNCQLGNWLRVCWDGEPGYHINAVVNLERVEAGEG